MGRLPRRAASTRRPSRSRRRPRRGRTPASASAPRPRDGTRPKAEPMRLGEKRAIACAVTSAMSAADVGAPCWSADDVQRLAFTRRAEESCGRNSRRDDRIPSWCGRRDGAAPARRERAVHPRACRDHRRSAERSSVRFHIGRRTSNRRTRSRWNSAPPAHPARTASSRHHAPARCRSQRKPTRLRTPPGRPRCTPRRLTMTSGRGSRMHCRMASGSARSNAGPVERGDLPQRRQCAPQLETDLAVAAREQQPHPAVPY